MKRALLVAVVLALPMAAAAQPTQQCIDYTFDHYGHYGNVDGWQTHAVPLPFYVDRWPQNQDNIVGWMLGNDGALHLLGHVDGKPLPQEIYITHELNPKSLFPFILHAPDREAFPAMSLESAKNSGLKWAREILEFTQEEKH